MSTFEAVKPLEPGKAVDVLERDENGMMIGAYFGYWNFKRQTVALYPNVKNRFVNWPGGRIPSGRIVVSDRQIRFKVQSAECRMQSAECRVQSAECRVQNGETRAQRKEPLRGQEEIKL